MSKVLTTRMSSKGQVVIPEEIRNRLKLDPGARFVVLGKGDVIILKTLASPSMQQFDEMIAEARSQAQTAGLKKVDIGDAIKKVRSKS